MQLPEPLARRSPPGVSQSDRPFDPPPEPPLLPLPGAGNPSFGETLAWLDRHINLEAIESGRAGHLGLPSLERINALLSALGDPQATYPVVHVTGTNGKGSTSRMTSALLRTCGLTVGTYMSPHLERINERLEFDGAEISDDSFARVLGTVAEIERFLGIRATWFELVTAAAYTWFADLAAEAVVAEVGLGGRFDATNVANADVAVVTNVELDHTQILGDTRELIASEKAGIIKSGSLLVLGEEDPSVAAIFEAEARTGRGAGDLEAWGRVRLLLGPSRRRGTPRRPLDAARALLRSAHPCARGAPGGERRGCRGRGAGFPADDPRPRGGERRLCHSEGARPPGGDAQASARRARRGPQPGRERPRPAAPW